MRSKLLAGTAALLLTAGTVLASAGSASAAPRWHGGFWPGAVAAGVAAGALAAATSPLWAPGYYDYYPGYAPGPYYDYVPPGAAPIAPAGVDVAWCETHFRSYNPATGSYLGFDGQYHSCP